MCMRSEWSLKYKEPVFQVINTLELLDFKYDKIKVARLIRTIL